MDGLKQRFVRQNAKLLSEWFRRLAENIDKLIPGQAVAAFPIWFTNEGGISMASVTVPDNSADLTAHVAFLDAEGHETTADDVPQWTSDNEDAAVVTAADDGLSGTVAIGAPGAAIISVDSTNTDGSTVHSEGTITVQPGDAVIGEVTFDTA